MLRWPNNFSRGQWTRAVRVPHARGTFLDDTEHLRDHPGVRHNDHATRRIRQPGPSETGEHPSPELNVRFAAWPGERVLGLRLVTGPQLWKLPLHSFGSHAFHVTAVDLARPGREPWLDAPDATELMRDFRGSFQIAGEECVRNLCLRPSLDKELKFSSDSWRQREIERAA